MPLDPGRVRMISSDFIFQCLQSVAAQCPWYLMPGARVFSHLKVYPLQC